MNKLVERFLHYVKYDTASNPKETNCPTTHGQMVLAETLKNELIDIGLKDVTLDENGYIMATLESNLDYETDVIGFIAHMDTSPDFSGANVNPRIIKDYDGEDINLSSDVVLKTEDFPEILRYKGQDIIVTDGSTLLGADNKAGIAEIITAMEYLIENPDIKHGTIKIGFTPDEEVGKGADKFDVELFEAKYAYTIDGGEIGELEYENFNAAYARITVNGRNVHPGNAKNKMINSITLAQELTRHLPKMEVPEHTEGYEGFYHLNDFIGNVEQTKLYYIIRDFDKDSFENRKKFLEEKIVELNNKYGEATFQMELKDQYYNMKEKIEPNMILVDKAFIAMEKAGVKPIVKPIRGGTDGARLSFMGLPTPNIFTGGHNFHGKYEYIPVKSMEKAVEVIINIAKEFADK